MTDLTICVPYANYHMETVTRAVRSIEAQTLPCDYILMADPESKGAGYTRNRALEQVKTPLCAFLDADDTLDPRFAELCLGVLNSYRAAGHSDARYVYTDWLIDDRVHIAPAPRDAWTQGTYHLVTTVMETEHVRRIGGFDEMMRGVEDTDFYIRLRLSRVCGLHVEKPLVQYREGGQRSITARATGYEALAQQYMTQRYGGYDLMGCCGSNTPLSMDPTNEPQVGDILAQAQWHGNSRKLGLKTGRLYPRIAHPSLCYVAESDVKAAPHQWKAVTNAVEASNGVILEPQYQPRNDWQDVANAIFSGVKQQTAPSQPIEYKPNVPGKSKRAVLEAAKGEK